MITPEQRKKLREIANKTVADLSASTGNLYYNGFLAGAESFARIQSEPNESDEETAIHWATTMPWNLQDFYSQAKHKESFLAGCARYRPLVEEMLAVIQKGWPEESDYGLIARAEKMLGKQDE